MPLSKAKNKERMRKSRLHKQLSALTESKPVQPDVLTMSNIGSALKTLKDEGFDPNYREIDADGNPIYEE